MVDRLDKRPPGAGLVAAGHVLLLGVRSADLGGSRVWKDAPTLPPFDVRAVSEVAAFVRSLVADGLLLGAHDVADGGIAGALGEVVARSGVGARITLDGVEELFSEASGRVLVCVAADRVDDVRARAGAVSVADLGTAGGARLVVEGIVDLAVADVVAAWRDALPSVMSVGAAH